MIPWLLRNTVAPVGAIKERSAYLQVAARLERERQISLDERLARQWLMLREIVDHAFQTTPFYRERFEQAGFEPGDLRRLEDLQKLPILTKQDIREHQERMLAGGADPRTLVAKRTSGSTGVSLEFFADEACMQTRRGVTLYRDRWTGWDLGEWQAMVWGNPPPLVTLRQRLRSELLERQFYLDTLRMDEGMMQRFAQRILKLRPTLLYGHAHSLFLFARFWQTHGLPPYPFRGVISTAMVLHAHERRGIEQAFQSPVFDRYGCEEVSLIASECEAHSGLHVNTDSLVVEVLPESGWEAAGGRIIVTDLLNRGMPFLRYEVGDRAMTSTRACTCGRTYPLLEGVAGRVADYLRTPRGEFISGISLTENFATLIPGVQQVQIVQDRLDHLLVRVVPAPTFIDTSRTKIADLVFTRFGPEVLHDVEIVERIPQGRTGKYRFAICEIPEGS